MPSVPVARSSALKSYLVFVAGLPRLDLGEQAALQEKISVGDVRALQTLTESFLPDVVAQACALRGRGLRFEALIAAGNRGLSEALGQKQGPLALRVRRGVERHLQAALARVQA